MEFSGRRVPSSSTLMSGANSARERFTSGTSTSIPMERHSAR